MRRNSVYISFLFVEYTGRPAGPMIVVNMEYGKDFSGAG